MVEKVHVGNENAELSDDKEPSKKSVLSHVKGHKLKYAAVTSAAIIVAVCCAILIVYIRSRKVPPNALISGKIGTTIPAVSAVPAKPLPSSSRRRLQLRGNDFDRVESTLGSLQRVLSTAGKDPSTFESSSEYKTFGESSLTVGDVSLESVNTINMIACLTKQMRAIDVGLNTTYNPGLKPYTAIIDSGLCGNSGIMTWAIKSSGPSGYGDGTYKSTASFSGFGALMHIEFTNIVADGALKKSSVAWSSAGGAGKGITVIDYSNPSLSNILLASSDGNYLHAIFNPTTFVGSVVSANANSPDKFYALDFNTNAINRRTTTTGGGGSVSTVCLDFSADKMLISGEQYTLFNAGDGSKKRQVMGYPITATVAGTTMSLYAGYWGLDASYVMSDDGKSIRYTPDQVKAAITDGLAVSVQQGDGSVASRTLKLVNGQMQVTSIETTTLGAIKGLPLTIADSGLQISWTGTKFVKESKYSYRCFWSEGDTLTPVTTTATLNSESEAQQHCLCLDPSGSNPYAVKASGACKNPSAHNDPGFDYGQFPESLPGSEEYVPQSSYDGTIQVRNQQFNGRINLNVDSLQQLSGVVNQHYSAGTVIKQNTTGAVGIIYEDTPTGMVGLTGSSVSFMASLAGNLVTVTNVTAGKVLLNWGFNVGGNYYTVASQLTSTETNSAPNGKGTYSLSSWSATQTFTAQTITGTYVTTYHQSGDRWQNYQTFCNFPSALSGDGNLKAGTALAQGSVSATVAGDWGGWGPLPVTMTAAGTKFDLTSTTPITVTAASMNGRWDTAGVLNFDRTAGVDDSWSNGNPVSIISSGVCTASSFAGSLELGAGSGDFNVTGVDGGSFGSTKPTVNLYNYGGQIWGYVGATGSSCQQTDLDGIKITFGCGAIIAVKCKTRFDSSSSTIRVKLAGSTKFASGQNKPIAVVSDPSKILTDPWFKGLWWVQDVIGNIKPSTDSTSVSYSFFSIAQPGDTVPAELWCYDNCPIGDDSTSSASTLGKYDSIKTVTEVSINNQGNCDVDAKNTSTVGFSGYTTNPAVLLGWTSNTDSSGTGTYFTLTSVTITDPGVLDLSSSSSPSWTLSHSAGVCSTAPTFNSINANHGDYKDYRGVYKYSYDPYTGVLTDKQNNNKTLIDSSADSDSSFGPFFAGTEANKAALLCPWNSNLVCSWQVWQKLSQTYNWRTGPNSLRVSLLDGDNKPMPFDAPTSMLYQVPQGTKSNSGTTYDGVNLFLTYYNFGQLQGIPQLCVDDLNMPANCISDSRFADHTSNINDIIMAPGAALKDFGGNSFYALPQVRTEYFPKATDAGICSALNFASLPSIPVFSNLFVPPSNDADPFPSDATLRASYFNKGLPVVIKGVTLYEMLGE